MRGKATRQVPYLAVVNVQDRFLSLSQIKTIQATDEEIEKYKLLAGDLLLTEGGDPDKLGRGTLWHEELPECIHQNHIFRVRLQTAELQPLFVNYLIGSQRGKRYFLRSAKQTTGIASINMTQLKGFPVLVPPIELQARFACKAKAIEEVALKCRLSIQKFNRLFGSLQRCAFIEGFELPVIPHVGVGVGH